MTTNTSHPTISRTLEDRTLIELLYDPQTRTTALAVGHLDGSARVEQHLVLASGEQLDPYSADNNLIANDCVLLPSAVGAFVDKSALLADVQAFIHRYVDLSETFEAVAAHYVLLSWVYDAFTAARQSR
jgi:hypothetical protein